LYLAYLLANVLSLGLSTFQHVMTAFGFSPSSSTFYDLSDTIYFVEKEKINSKFFPRLFKYGQGKFNKPSLYHCATMISFHI
jgi:hypothetical protein